MLSTSYTLDRGCGSIQPHSYLFQHGISGFEKVVLDLGASARTVRKVTVCGYDRYLHYAEQTVKIDRLL